MQNDVGLDVDEERYNAGPRNFPERHLLLVGTYEFNISLEACLIKEGDSLPALLFFGRISKRAVTHRGSLSAASSSSPYAIFFEDRICVLTSLNCLFSRPS